MSDNQVRVCWNSDGDMVIVHSDGQELPIPQGEETEYACSIARYLGWQPCTQCDHTDGSIDCKHHTAIEMTMDALDHVILAMGDNGGKTEWFDNPGWFE